MYMISMRWKESFWENNKGSYKEGNTMWFIYSTTIICVTLGIPLLALTLCFIRHDIPKAIKNARRLGNISAGLLGMWIALPLWAILFSISSMEYLPAPDKEYKTTGIITEILETDKFLEIKFTTESNEQVNVYTNRISQFETPHFAWYLYKFEKITDTKDYSIGDRVALHVMEYNIISEEKAIDGIALNTKKNKYTDRVVTILTSMDNTITEGEMKADFTKYIMQIVFFVIVIIVAKVTFYILKTKRNDTEKVDT